jgi:TonB-dependent SusC/RagA subfamily outer membrane receptor
LENVKIGVTTSVRVTHKSIGETNNSWENNRVIFTKKYKNNLPIKVQHKNLEGLNILVYTDSESINDSVYQLVNYLNKKSDVTVLSFTENISVLKDGASLTAYGAQGSAGVIIISTKKGTTLSNGPVVENYSESAYAYFIDHKTNLKIIGLDDKTIIEGVIKKQVDTGLVFINKRKEVIVPIKLIKRVEMLPSDD